MKYVRLLGVIYLIGGLLLLGLTISMGGFNLAECILSGVALGKGTVMIIKPYKIVGVDNQ